MVEKMRPYDRVSIVAYDDLVDLVIPSVNCLDKNIINSINNIDRTLPIFMVVGLWELNKLLFTKVLRVLIGFCFYQMVTLMLVYVMLMNLKFNALISRN